MEGELVRADLPESFAYSVKRFILGPPKITAQLHQERLSNPLALGVLAPDCISSSAYGTEEILIELLPYAGLAAFTLVLPITGVILGILVLLALAYREVVMVYTRAGGSYVVSREQFGPRVAQVAAVALLIDYVVTVAVQTAAGTVAVVSAVPSLGPYHLLITLGVVVLLCYGNLRGLREAGRLFAFPTYFFVGSVLLMIVVGLARDALGHLHRIDATHVSGAVTIHRGNALVMGASLLVLLRAFANGGSSLTGLEAISNGVSAFRKPQGLNARRVLTIMAVILGTLVAGVSWLAYRTHAVPHDSGYPSVISQEAKLVFGSGPVGHVLFLMVQTASALILYTGANTSFNGFPFLASYVAEDQFLPRQLRARGHRLVFSNAIILLAVVSGGLLLVTDAKVNALVPFYAIGVFTGFAMAGFGMARHHQRNHSPGWRYKIAISLAAGILSAAVVAIFAIAKFTEGAWAVVVLFPLLWWALIRVNRRYRAEAAVLFQLDPAELRAPNYSRHVVLVAVDMPDLATAEAVRYGRSLKPTELRAVHLMIDSQRAERVRKRWDKLDSDIPLEIIDVPDRRIGRAVQELVLDETRTPRTEVTLLIPRPSYPGLLGRLLHGQNAEKMARVVSRVPHAVATIVPFDTTSRLRAYARADARARAEAEARAHDGPDESAGA
ncbi:MAG: APC family permease [Mycobacteriales bacterium]